ncbi:MAG: glycosyltransferase family 4 protein [Magnetospirillum sp.]|nr:glycosyltransferase family 4 protein [Magnetospirillum sp.]
MRLTLFMSRRMSLRRWDESGMLDRELAVYRRLVERGVDVALLSWGGPDERAYDIAPIRVLYNRWALPAELYERIFPLLHARWLSRRGIYKTNQVDVGLQAMLAVRWWRNPLVARCGYLWSDFRARSSGTDSPGAQAARHLEARLFAAADRIVVTTTGMAADIAGRLPGLPAATIVPNYVDTDRFRPDPSMAKDTDVLFIGRLAAQKNEEMLLKAVEVAGVSLVMVGDGPDSAMVETYRQRLGARLTWHRRVPHTDLPGLMRRSRLFVLPSLYEGHPKALIEAMACAMPVIAANAPGICEMIRDGVTGRLIESDPGALAASITGLLADPALAERLGAAARAAAIDNFGLDQVVEQEAALYRGLAQEWGLT